jgi:hypothetical protein
MNHGAKIQKKSQSKLILPWNLCFIGRYNSFATELRQNIPTFAADLRIEVMFWDLVSGY